MSSVACCSMNECEWVIERNEVRGTGEWRTGTNDSICAAPGRGSGETKVGVWHTHDRLCVCVWVCVRVCMWVCVCVCVCVWIRGAPLQPVTATPSQSVNNNDRIIVLGVNSKSLDSFTEMMLNPGAERELWASFQHLMHCDMKNIMKKALDFEQLESCIRIRCDSSTKAPPQFTDVYSKLVKKKRDATVFLMFFFSIRWYISSDSTIFFCVLLWTDCMYEIC